MKKLSVDAGKAFGAFMEAQPECVSFPIWEWAINIVPDFDRKVFRIECPSTEISILFSKLEENKQFKLPTEYSNWSISIIVLQ